MKKNNVRFRLTYVKHTNSIKCGYPETAALPTAEPPYLMQTYDMTEIMRHMEPVAWFKNMKFVCQRMLLGVTKELVRNRIMFDMNNCHWNMFTWQEEIDNEFDFG